MLNKSLVQIRTMLPMDSDVLAGSSCDKEFGETANPILQIASVSQLPGNWGGGGPSVWVHLQDPCVRLCGWQDLAARALRPCEATHLHQVLLTASWSGSVCLAGCNTATSLPRSESNVCRGCGASSA